MVLNYDVNAKALRADLRSLLYWPICGMGNEIDACHGKMRVTDQRLLYSKVYLDEDDAARHGL